MRLFFSQKKSNSIVLQQLEISEIHRADLFIILTNFKSLQFQQNLIYVS